MFPGRRLSVRIDMESSAVDSINIDVEFSVSITPTGA